MRRRREHAARCVDANAQTEQFARQRLTIDSTDIDLRGKNFLSGCVISSAAHTDKLTDALGPRTDIHQEAMRRYRLIASGYTV